MKNIILLFIVMIVFFTASSQTINTLTEKEKKEGWKLLFNTKCVGGMEPVSCNF